MSDDSSKKPPNGKEEDLPALSEEDLFLKTKVGSSSEATSQEVPLEENAQEPIPFEMVDSFESLDTLPSEPSIKLEPPEELSASEEPAQQVPSFDISTASDLPTTDFAPNSAESAEFAEFAEFKDGLASQEPGQEQQFVPEFSASIPPQAEPPVQSSGSTQSGGSTASFTQPTPAQPTKTIDSIKNFSESLNEEAPAVAQLPFTLRIEGKLNPQEAEKLLDVLSREKMDIREVDIEPQLEAGRILIPRISEYAGVMLIQALRGVRAKIYFQPSDIDSDALTDTLDTGSPSDYNESFAGREEPPTADSLPVTQGDDLPQLGVFQVIDTLIVSGMLSTRSVEALNSNEYTNLTEALIRELKFKAVRRGARGITHLSIQLTPLTLPTDYRVTVSGTAVG